MTGRGRVEMILLLILVAVMGGGLTAIGLLNGW